MVYGGLIGEGVVKSTDGGAHWVLSNAGMAPFLTRLTRVTAIAVDPSTPATVYAGTIRPQRQPFSGDVYKSTDGGATWTQLPHPHLGLFVTALAIDPSTPSTVYAMSGTVYKSTDGGLTWAVAGPADALLDVVAIDPVMPTTLYAGSSTPGLGFPLFKSIDGGASWVPINIGLGSLPIRAIAIDRFTRRTAVRRDHGGRVPEHGRRRDVELGESRSRNHGYLLARDRSVGAHDPLCGDERRRLAGDGLPAYGAYFYAMTVLEYARKDVDQEAWKLIASREPFDLVVRARFVRRTEGALPVFEEHLDSGGAQRGLRFIRFAVQSMRAPVMFVIYREARRHGMVAACRSEDSSLVISFRAEMGSTRVHLEP